MPGILLPQVRPCISILFLLLLTAVTIGGWCKSAYAHFSYSDPRIIHLAEQSEKHSVILVRMPAPLALLPGDWQGKDDERIPPFALKQGNQIKLDLSSFTDSEALIQEKLAHVVTLIIGGQPVVTQVEKFRFWDDNQRPRFGTLKTAFAAFNEPVDQKAIVQTSYFDLTLDVMITVPQENLSGQLRLESALGQNFQVMDRLGTVIKLHRDTNTETKAIIGVLDVSFPGVVRKSDVYLQAALTGAEHIYLGLDHLAIILLIAIASPNWRRALIWASAFTVGHMTTLIGGLYGFAPVSPWFVPLVELAIAVSIVVTGVLVLLKQRHRLGWTVLLLIGMIHGYGFAASASEALFSGSFDPMNLVAFALGLELCQLLVYALVLPIILFLDRTQFPVVFGWRRAGAFGIAISACVIVVMRLSESSKLFGVI